MDRISDDGFDNKRSELTRLLEDAISFSLFPGCSSTCAPTQGRLSLSKNQTQYQTLVMSYLDPRLDLISLLWDAIFWRKRDFVSRD